MHAPSSNDLPMQQALQETTCCPNCHAVKSPYPISGPITTKNIIASGDSTSVHKTLQIPEILRHVYEGLAQEDKKHTLVSMAQVCRAFTESALDVIWHHLVGLTPLLSVLPVGHADGVMVRIYAQYFLRLDLYIINPIISQVHSIRRWQSIRLGAILLLC